MSDKKRKVPKLRFPGFTDDWEQRKLGDEFQKVNERNDGSFGREHWISVAKMYFQEPEKVQSNNIDTRTYVMREGDIAFEGHPNSEFKFGRFVANDIGSGVVSELFPIYRHKVQYDNKYWKYAIQLERIMAPIFAKSITSSGNSSNKLEPSHFLRQSMPVATYEEQKVIGDFLNKLESLLSLHQRKLDNVKMLKKSLLQKLFPKDGEKIPELRFPGFTDAWEQRKLGEIAKIIGGGTPSTSNPEYWDGGIDWYSPAEIGSQIYVSKSVRQISDLGLQKSSAKLLPEGSVLFTSRAGIGNTAILAKESCTNQGFQSIVPNKGMLDTYFIFSQSHALKKYGETVGAGSTFVEVSGKQMERMDISLPIIQEQEKIGAYFKQMDSLLSLHQRKLDHLKELKKGLLQQMFV